MWLLHIVLIRSFEHSSFYKVGVIESKLNRDVHWIFELLNSLLHRAEIACKVRARLLFYKWKHYSELVKKIIDSREDRMKW